MTDRINERNKEIMSSIFDKVQPAVKKETRKVAMITAVGLVLMWIAAFLTALTGWEYFRKSLPYLRDGQ